MTEPKKNKKIVRVLWFLILIGFAIMEFPGIFFINRIEPTIFGFPFIYGFMIIMWLYMCVVLLAAYKTRWGKGDDDHRKGDFQQ